MLYGLLLDRMSLSAKNGWYDGAGRVYIYYTLEEIQNDLRCTHGKAVKLLAELDKGKGFGLIERVKQGQGRPTKIVCQHLDGWCLGLLSASPLLTSDNPFPSAGAGLADMVLMVVGGQDGVHLLERERVDDEGDVAQVGLHGPAAAHVGHLVSRRHLAIAVGPLAVAAPYVRFFVYVLFNNL